MVDLYDSFHPESAAAAAVDLRRIVWVRCQGSAEHAMRSADLLLHAGGFGIILLDLCEANAQILNRIPLSYWHRFRKAVEQTTSIFLVCAETAQAKSCANTSLYLQHKRAQWTGQYPSLLLTGLDVSAVVRRAAAAVPKELSIKAVA